MAATFTQALSIARRKAALRGRSLSQQETSGIAEGHANIADAAAARAKQLELHEQELVEKRKEAAARRKGEKHQREQQKKQNVGSTIGVGATVGAYAGAGTSVGGPWGAVIGAGVGLVAGLISNNSVFCSEIQRQCGVGDIDKADCVADELHALASYTARYHKPWFEFYMAAAPVAVERMRQAYGDLMRMRCQELKKVLLDPTVALMNAKQPESAFTLYKSITLPLILVHAPEFKEQADMISVGVNEEVSDG